MSLSKIVAIQEAKRQKDIDKFKKIYKMAESKINKYAEYGSKACLYQIPTYVYGYPLVDIPKTMEYLLARLNHKGFIAFEYVVEGQPCDSIYISWDLASLKNQEMREDKKEIMRSKLMMDEKKENEKSNDLLFSSLVDAKRGKHRNSKKK